jgi:Response regulator containing a CheY-like receiver domain and an HTH DNA-binding domain
LRIVIVDDDKLVCMALKTILEAEDSFQIIDIGNNPDEAIALYDKHKPDLMLMDIRMGEKTGIDAGKIILEKDAQAKILYLTTFDDNEYILDALKIGAKGYLLKQNFDIIIPSIKAVELGQRVFGDEIISKIPNMMKESPKPTNFTSYPLTEKEIEIIILVAEGLSNKEIATSSFLSEGTIRNYISTILEKLDLRDRTQLAIFYYKNQ